jgi:4-amino-4-deoxy-L-arabinose transferase-like glycosyltransferase
VRRIRSRRRYGFGHLFGLLFLFRHPVVLLVVVAVVLVVYLSRRRR